MQYTYNKRIEKQLFYVLLIFSCITYIGYYIYARRNGISLLVSYSKSSSRMMSVSNPIIMFFRFGKDVAAALLFLVELMSTNRTIRARVLLGIIAVASYGTLIALINTMTFSTIVSGYRMLLYFGALAMFFHPKTSINLSLKSFFKVIIYMLAINTVIAGLQAYDRLGFNIGLIGAGSYRFMGLFPAAAAFAYFCLGAVLFAFSVEACTKQYGKSTRIVFIIAFIGCYFSGTRSSMINLLIVIFVYIIQQTRIKDAHKILLSILLAFPVIIYIVQFSSGIANRGSILANAVGGGRITKFINYTFGQPTVKVLFGNGIGAGSNSATEFFRNLGNGELLFLDGAFTTIIYQFGIIGFIPVLVFMYRICKRVFVQKGFLNAALFAGTLILQCMTTNVLEAFALLIMLFMSYYVLVNGQCIFWELELENMDV